MSPKEGAGVAADALEGLVGAPLSQGLIRAPYSSHVEPRPRDGQTHVPSRKSGGYKTKTQGPHDARYAVVIGPARSWVSVGEGHHMF